MHTSTPTSEHNAAALPPLRVVRVYPNLRSVYHLRRQPAAIIAQVQRLFEEYTYAARADQTALDFIAEIFGFDQNMAFAEGYRVMTDADPPQPMPYDFWCYDHDQGLVFEAGAVTPTGVVYVEREFVVAPEFPDPHGRAAALALALNAADIVDPPDLDPDAPLIIERDAERRKWLVGFTVPDAVPATPAAWDELLGGNYLLLREDFVRRHGPGFGLKARQIQWSRATLSEAYIHEFARTRDDWHRVSFGQKLSEEFIRAHAKKLRWQSISSAQRVSEAFIREFHDRVDWSSVSMSQRLSEPFIREFADRLDWCYIGRHQQLSEPFLAEFAARLNFRDIDPQQPRSIAYYSARHHQLDWERISQHASLSESDIRALAAWVSWRQISEYQRLSTAFVEEFSSQIKWLHFSRNRHLTDEQIEHFKDRLDWLELTTHTFSRQLSEALIRQHEALIPPYAWRSLFLKPWFSAQYRAEVAARGLSTA